MQKLGFPISKSLDQFKSLYGSESVNAKPLSSLSSRPSGDYVASGSFANLKLTAEKLVKEQASVKTDVEIANTKLKKSLEHIRALEEKLQNAFNENASDLEIANTKLKKSLEHIRALEEKLQNAFNENAKLKVRQKGDEKLWKGLESKFSSTKTLYNQLTETLQQLSGLVQDAEKDKERLESKLSASSESLERLTKQMDGLSLKLDSAQETIKARDKELEKLKFATEEREKFYSDEKCRAASVIQGKDTMIKNLEETLTSSRLDIENLNSKLGELHLPLKVKEDEILHHIVSQEKSEKVNSALQLCNAELTEKLDTSLQEIKNLEGTFEVLAASLLNLDKESLILMSKFDEMNSLYASCFKLVLQERETFSKHAQNQYDELNNKFLILSLERDAIQMTNKELSNSLDELRKVQESTVAQHIDECRLAAERIQCLESEAEALISQKEEAKVMISKLEEKAESLLESSRSSENQMQGLLLKVSALETESKENMERMQTEILKKSEEFDALQKERMKLEQHADSFDKEVLQLQNDLEEKEQCILQYKEQEKKMEDQIKENTTLLTNAESKLTEARKQYDQMQLELSKHLKEISQRNDQAINDIKRKYELEKMEIVNKEKDKADKAIAEIEARFDQKLAECKEESSKQLMHIQEEHTKLVTQMQQEHEKRQLSLIAEHSKQLQRTQLQAENDLREKTMFMRNDHEAQIKALRCELEDECQKLEEELHLQKSKVWNTRYSKFNSSNYVNFRNILQEDLLQLQWKVMSDKPKEDQEVNSKQVTRIEYEVETSNGRTVTTKRKIRSTVLFKEPRKRKMNTPKTNTPGSVIKVDTPES